MYNMNRMGSIYVTDILDFVITVPDEVASIISLDEEHHLNPNDPNVLPGTVLLPPIEAVMAEADGDEDLYDIHYATYLNSPAAQDFLGAIISALYFHKNILIYAPQMRENISIYKLMQFIWSMYGIHIGTMRKDECFYDKRCIPIWVNTVYRYYAIDAEQFIRDYPPDAPIQEPIMNRLLNELRPYGKSYQERIDAIERYRRRCAYNSKTKMPIYNLGG